MITELITDFVYVIKISGRPIYRAIFGIFQISALADKFFCLADAFEVGLLFWRRTAAPEHTVLTFSLLFTVVVNSSV